MNWYAEVLKKYAVGSGRARRQEFWMFYLVNTIVAFALAAVDVALGSGRNGRPGVLSMLYALAIIVPAIAVSVRRLHDTGRSGWWYFIGFVPFIGGIVLLVFLASPGQIGPNQYGLDPKTDVAPSAPAGVPAGWHADPTGRHELRYWDSRQWTEHVSDAGVASTDPMSA